MSEPKYTSEQMERIKELKKEWMEEVEKYFNETHLKNPDGTLDGGGDSELLKIQEKYIRKVQDEVGEITYEKEELTKGGYRKFSDIIMQVPDWIPKLPDI